MHQLFILLGPCTNSITCGKGWFCDLRDGSFGFCYKCDNYPRCEEAGQGGEQECKEVCKRCNESKKCDNDQFCNYEDSEYGFCEMCNNVQSCDEQLINGPEGGVECNVICYGKAKCNGSEDCGSNGFCSLENPEYGFCEMCENTKGCDAPSEYIVAPEGQEECNEVCKGRCNTTTVCGTDQFCNWENPDYGFCEQCNEFESCKDPKINVQNGDGEVECNEVCNGKTKCNGSEYCGADSFCSWRDPEYGFCEMCQNTNGCEGPSDYIVDPEGQDECKKICECKCNSPMVGREQQTKDEREECNQICHGM